MGKSLFILNKVDAYINIYIFFEKIKGQGKSFVMILLNR